MKKLLLLMCMILTFLFIVGCESQKTPDEVVTKFCDSVIALDVDEMNSCIANSNNVEISEEMIDVLKIHTNNINYAIRNYTENETTANVYVEAYYPDLFPNIMEAVNQYVIKDVEMTIKGLSEKEKKMEFESILIENIKNADPDMKISDINFKCSMTAEGWKIDEDINNTINNFINNTMKRTDF